MRDTLIENISAETEREICYLRAARTNRIKKTTPGSRLWMLLLLDVEQ